VKARKIYGNRFKDPDSAGYIFPRREACLMVMSYGYELQAAIFDLLVKADR
jgi:hypothetical protein